MKGFMPHDYIYMKFQKRQNYRKESGPAVALGLWVREGRGDGLQRGTKNFTWMMQLFYIVTVVEGT